ncbi:ABC transporter substrate-binding protein [Limnobacter humi]|uniref:ABC transporter substrate-binding protein n=1 Tax=Limnobacter humi TaxID=1778671 RepID=A0ABT1WHJ2_9BURK|nr:CmpA/NrtA family ABC transporter substrate-binding protein [Limnobacter humi]MCQ8896980.1 ABC transporter substrate-binding protein [Limnobacter humi]
MSAALKIGILALTDSAPFVVAQHLSLFARAGMDVVLERQPSWATLRDKLVYGEIQAAHMLAPMAIAVELGLGGSPRKSIRAPLVLSRGGNGVTVSNALWEVLQAVTVDYTLGDALRARKAQGLEPLVFGTVFRFSMHTLQLRRWLKAQGVDPDVDVRFEALPPIRMVQALRTGEVDAFCAGEPWGSLAVSQRVGHMVATSSQLWPDAPEKVLGFSTAWAYANAPQRDAVVRVVQTACHWLQEGEANRRQAAQWLSMAEFANVPADLLERALLNTPVINPAVPALTFDGQPLSQADLQMLETLWLETQSLCGPLGAQSLDGFDRVKEVFNVMG